MVPPGDLEAAKEKSDGKTPVTQNVLSVSANLVQLLPTGSVMAYKLLAPSFSNNGNCLPSNWWLTLGLVVVLGASCIFFAFTDSVVHKGKVYYGLALPGRFNVFNMSKAEEDEEFKEIKADLEKRGLKRQDFVHATLTVVVFLTMALNDVGLQKCFFPKAGTDTQQLLKNLPLGMAVFSSLVFTIFPTKRNFIGCSDPLGGNKVTAAPNGDGTKDTANGGQSTSTPASASTCTRCCGCNKDKASAPSG